MTGANRGIGRAIAERFVAAGDRVATIYRGGDLPDGVLGVRGDVRDTAAVDAAFTAIEAEPARSRCSSPTPASPSDQLLMRMTDEEFDAVIDVNLTGAFRCVRRATKGMIRRAAAASCSSPRSSACTGRPGQVNYAASKSAWWAWPARSPASSAAAASPPTSSLPASSTPT